MGIFGRPYIDLDGFIDTAALQALNLEVIEGIIRAKKKLAFYGTGLIRHKEDQGLKDLSEVQAELRRIPGFMEKLQERFSDPDQLREYISIRYKAATFGQVIPLNETVAGGYDGISYARCNRSSPNVEFFPGLMKFVASLPMKEVGRVEVFLSPANSVGRMHTDGTLADRKRTDHEFFWLRTNLDKKFYVFDPERKLKTAVTSYSAYFNSLEPHGYDMCPFQTFSLRVDGFFNDDFARKVKNQAPTVQPELVT